MAKYKKGIDAEERLITKLGNYGYKIDTDEQLDHEYKLDFVIHRFPECPRRYNIGIQLTTRRDDLAALREFTNIHLPHPPVTDKVIYLELEEVDIENGGGQVVSAALIGCIFDQKYTDHKAIGVHIYTGLKYEIYDLQDKMAQFRTIPSMDRGSDLQREQVVKMVNRELEGYVNTYDPTKGYGFVLWEDNIEFFFHINSSEDPRLEDKLLSCVGESADTGQLKVEPPIQVVFVNSGYKQGRSPTAIKLRLIE